MILMKIAYYSNFGDKAKENDPWFPQHTGYTFSYNTANTKTDIIYADTTTVLAEALKAKKKLGKALICWCWDIPYDWYTWKMPLRGYFENLYRIIKNANTIRMLKQCDLVLTGSKFTQKTLKKFGIESTRMDSYINTEKIDSIKQPRKKKQIIQISRFFYNKKFETTIEATAHLKDYEVILIGTKLDSHYGRWLQELAKASTAKVTFLNGPSTETVIKKIKESTVLVSPSVFEGWGMTPLEALYAGVPVIVSDLEVFKETYGKKVLYHKQHDAASLRRQLNKLLRDKKLQKKIVKECAPVVAKYNPRRFSKNWKEQIETFMASSDHARP